MKFKIGDKVRTEFGDGEVVFINKENRTKHYLVKIKGFEGHLGSSGSGYVNEDGLNDKWWFSERQLELLEIEETSVNEKIKRDLIKLLFEKEFSVFGSENMYDYKGRIITGYLHKNATFIDFIEKVNKEYGIKGHEVANIIIKEFNIEEYKEEE